MNEVIRRELIMDQQGKKASAVPVVFSVIALSFSALALICAVLLLIVSIVGPESGGTSTAITNRAFLTVSGMIFFTAFAWGFAMLGEVMGLVMTIVDIAIKRVKIIWIPAVALGLGIVSMILTTAAY